MTTRPLALVFLLAVTLLLGSWLTVDADATQPKVSDASAYHFTAITLGRHFLDWRQRDSGSIRCGDRLKKSKVRCFVEWTEGNIEYGGRTVIWFRRDPRGLMWFYAYRIKRVNVDCVRDGARHCSKFYVVY